MSLLTNLRQTQFFGRCLTCAQKSFGNSNGHRTIANRREKKVAVIEPLPEREIVRVHGEEVTPFLQGLITNDMSQLHKPKASKGMYAMFLNKSGRVLYDTIIYRTRDPHTYLIECDKNISNELRRHLRLHRVRRKIQIDSMDKEFSVWAVFDPMSNETEECGDFEEPPNVKEGVIINSDPRLRDLGKRVITRPEATWNDLARLYSRLGEVSTITSNSKTNYQTQRYRFGVAEGVQEMPPGKCFPLEANGDYLNGVNFHKGCYLGQELTARVYHTGVIRKRHMPIRLSVPLSRAKQAVETPAGKKVGTLIGATADKAVGLLRIEHVVHNNSLMIDGEPCYAVKPKWWPKEMPDGE